MKTLRCLILFAMFHSGVALATPSGDETGITDNRILIGQSAAFSGPSASLGIQFSSGAMAYFNMINAQGGIYGRKLEIIAIDDQYEPALTIQNSSMSKAAPGLPAPHKKSPVQNGADADETPALTC